jgi:hypothetical protein
VSVTNEEDVIGVETDGVCVPQGCEPEVRWDDFCGGGFWCIYLYVVCTHGTAEIDWLVVLFVCLELCICYSVTVDTLFKYYSICRCIHLKTVWQHNAGCELYSSHIETKILAMNVTFKSTEKIIIVVATDSRSRTIMAVLLTCSCSFSADWIWYSY